MFSDTLKMLRLSRGLTQQEVANSISVSQGTIYFWENNINKPSSIYLSKLATLFGVSIIELLDEDEVTASSSLDFPKRNSNYQELLNLFSKLNNSQQNVIIAVLRELNKSPKRSADNSEDIDDNDIDDQDSENDNSQD